MSTVNRCLMNIRRFIVHVDHVPLVVDRGDVPRGSQDLLCGARGDDHPVRYRVVLRGVSASDPGGGRQTAAESDYCDAGAEKSTQSIPAHAMTIAPPAYRCRPAK